MDEEIHVAAPEQCPDCGGPLTVERVESQYQEEIVRRTWVRRFHIPICRGAQRHNRVQGRRPLQTSDALGAAAVQVGPEAVTLGVLMNKSLGLPHADAAVILKQGFALRMSRGGICRAIQRVARKAEATWHALREAARRSALAHMDETGWKVEAQLHWLWAVVTEQVSFYEILPGRGFAEAAEILGADYGGWLIHDGLQLYYKFLKAAHQSCVAHLIRRCRDLAEVAPASRKSRCTDCGRLPGGWKQSWTACWRGTIATRPTADWPSTCATNALTCSPFCIVRGWWMPPTIWRSA